MGQSGIEVVQEKEVMGEKKGDSDTSHKGDEEQPKITVLPENKYENPTTYPMRYQPQQYLINQSPEFEDVQKNMSFSKPIYKEDIELPHRPMIIRKHKRYIEPAVFIGDIAQSELSELVEFSTEKKEVVVVEGLVLEEQV